MSKGAYPVGVGAAPRHAVRGKVGVEAIEPPSEQVRPVLSLDPQPEHYEIRRA